MREPLPQPAGGVATIEKVERDEPPQRGVDAAEGPEVGLLPAHVDEFRDLAVFRLVPGKREQPGRGFARTHGISRERHADRAHRGVATEYRRIAAGLGAR